MVEKGDGVPSTRVAYSAARSDPSVNKVLGYQGDVGQQTQSEGGNDHVTCLAQR